MDLKIKKKSDIRLKISFILGLSLVVIYLLWPSSVIQKNVLSKSDVIISEVSKGNITLKVKGYGVLKPKRREIITSVLPGVVSSINLYSGHKVNKSSVILTIANPQIDNEINSIDSEMSKILLQKNSLMHQQKTTLLQEKVTQARSDMEFKLAEIRLKAETVLNDKEIISDYQLEEAKLRLKLYAEQLQLRGEMIESVEKFQKEEILILDENYNRLKNEKMLLMEQKNKLKVKPTFDGEIQAVYVELGQAISQGEKLALVGERQNLIANIKVPQSKVKQIKIGDKVQIPVSSSMMTGLITRISSAIEDGTVMVEADIVENVGLGKPNLSIEAEILVDRLENSLFVRKPANVGENEKTFVYRLNNNGGGTAEKITIETGYSNGNQIIIKSGLNAGDKIVISDTSKYKRIEQLKII